MARTLRAWSISKREENLPYGPRTQLIRGIYPVNRHAIVMVMAATIIITIIITINY